MKSSIFFDKVQFFIENKINTKREKSYKKKTSPKTFKSEALDWLSAFVFAIVVISLLNMWGCQQFIVPTGSMEPTVLGGDRLVVNKRAYGTELYSYGPKRSDKTPERGDVITFYNPEYKSSGAFVESFRDLLFLGTLSIVNLNKDKDGNPLEKMFIKRAIGLPGDTVKFVDGNVYVKRYGDSSFNGEEEVQKTSHTYYAPYRAVNENNYDAIRAFGRLNGYRELGLESSIPNYIKNDVQGVKNLKEFDYYEGEKELDKQLHSYEPWKTESLSNITSKTYGIYVKQNHILPLGDNRDGSADGRFFGPIDNKKINGKALSIIFPPKHIKSL